MGTYVYGNFSYYCDCLNGSCDTGTGGACGDCNDNYSHIAWPELTTTGCNLDCDDVNPGRGCGTVVVVYDACKGKSSYAAIKDCLPAIWTGCNLNTCCDGSCGYNPTYRRPVADLTTSLFRKLHGSLADGRIRGWVYVY